MMLSATYNFRRLPPQGEAGTKLDKVSRILYLGFSPHVKRKIQR